MHTHKTWKYGAVLALVLASTGAWAGNNNNQNNSDTINNYGDTITHNKGGAGGDGGDGGLGIGIGVGQGGEGGQGGSALAIGGTSISQGGVGVGVGGEADANSKSQSGAAAGAKAGATSGGNSLTVNEGDFETRAIPVGSSIAAGANATTKCALHESKSFNLFFASIASSGHEPDYMCWAQELGHPEVAIQMACNDDDSFRKAFNQVARRNGVEECLDN